MIYLFVVLQHLALILGINIEFDKSEQTNTQSLNTKHLKVEAQPLIFELDTINNKVLTPSFYTNILQDYMNELTLHNNNNNKIKPSYSHQFNEMR
eukprot:UN05004